MVSTSEPQVLVAPDAEPSDGLIAGDVGVTGESSITPRSSSSVKLLTNTSPAVSTATAIGPFQAGERQGLRGIVAQERARIARDLDRDQGAVNGSVR